MSKQDTQFSINCGDWIYPHRDSPSAIKYPIDYPLTAFIGIQEKHHKINYASGHIDCHLHSKRRIHFALETSSVDEDLQTLHILRLTNDEEPDYSITFSGARIRFSRPMLPRTKNVTIHEQADKTVLGTFVADVLLLNYLEQKSPPDDEDDDDGEDDLTPALNPFDKFITIRKATLNEIVSIGRWC